MPDASDYATPVEAAKLTGLHLNTIYTLLHDGTLPATKHGRRYLIECAEIEFLKLKIIRPSSGLPIIMRGTP